MLRQAVFREAFADANAPANVVHPRCMIERAFAVYKERPLIGEPRQGGAVQWWNYAQCGAAAMSLARDLRQSCTGSSCPAVVICALNSAGWLVADWACALAALPSIVIDGSIPPDKALLMARDASSRLNCTVVASCVDDDRVSAWQMTTSLAGGAVKIFSTADARGRLMQANSIVDGGNDAAALPAAAGSDSLTCLFSFGSTGEPKPLWFDSIRWAEWGERNPPASRRGRAALARRSVRVSCAALFAPLSHGLARRTAWGELLHGGRLGLCNSRGARAKPDWRCCRRCCRRCCKRCCRRCCSGAAGGIDLLEQIHAIAPTVLSAAPRFYSLYERRFEVELAAAAKHTRDEALARRAAFSAVRSLAGDRLRLVAVGGAVVPPAQLRFLQECFGEGGEGGGRAVVSNGYGMSEVPGGIARNGVPLPGVEIKLLRRVGDSEHDEMPTQHDESVGEILVKTSRGVIVGDDGKAALDAEGWFRTGDLGRWVEQADGQRILEVIERVGFTVKLANGEFLAPQSAERVYEQSCPSIGSCVLHARPGDLAATAIIIPRGSADEAAAILEEMRIAASAAGLRSWEVPGRVVLDSGPWDERNGCCSIHGKVRRLAIAQRNNLLAGVGSHGDGDEDAAPSATADDDDDGCTLVCQLAAFLLATDDADAVARLPAGLKDVLSNDWWSAIGGDSVMAAELVAQYEQQELTALQRIGPGAKPPDSSPALTVHDLYSLSPLQLRSKAQARLGHAGTPSVAQEADVLTPSFWEREAVCLENAHAAAVRREVGRNAHKQADSSGHVDRCVLLTGATGFLGPHLVDALRTVSLHCHWTTIAVLVRGSIDRLASIQSAVSGAANGAAVSGTSQEDGHAERSRCKVVAFLADLSKPDLGLEPSDRTRLHGLNIIAVVHSAAIVDHARPYDALRTTNVDAASAIVELISPSTNSSRQQGNEGGPAAREQPPLFVFVSTMSVIPIASAAIAAGWDGSAESLIPPACAAALESGYARSKLIAEHHLASAALEGRIRLVIARLGLIGPTKAESSCYADLAERRDWLSLLLSAIKVTGASPAGLASSNRSVAVLPVDVAATSIAAAAATACGRQEMHDCVRVTNLDAAAFNIPPRPIAMLLDEIEASRGQGLPPLRRDLPYPDWRRLVASAGPPAVLALAMLPPQAVAERFDYRLVHAADCVIRGS